VPLIPYGVRYDELAPMLLGVVQQQATIAADRAP
jgi:hypothetical protein